MSALVSVSTSKHKEDVLKALDEIPRTPNEIAEKLGVHQRTAQTILLELALEGKVKHRKVGRFHLFWK